MRAPLIKIMVLGAVIVVTGCTVGPDYKPPVLDLPEAYSVSYIGQERDGRPWWHGFQDERLNKLVHKALVWNNEIGAAQARLAEVNALVGAERADLFPQLDAALDGRYSDTPGSGTSTSGSAVAVLSFTPDLFGGQRRRLERARAQAQSAAFSLDDVRRLTAAAVVSRYVDLRRNRARLDLLDQSLDLQNQTLNIVRQRHAAGLAADLDVERAAADVARTRAQRGTLTAAAARAQTALSVLLGDRPGTSYETATDDPVPIYASGPRAGVPADMIRQRPDVRAAEEALRAAVADIGVERADLYPSLRLPGQVTASLGGSQIVAGNLSTALNALLDIPLLDAGRRLAEVRAARHRADAVRYRYVQTVLESLRDVENALAAIQGLKERRDELRRAIASSEQAFNQLNALYKEGLASFIDILDGQRVLINSREIFLDAQADLALATIDLYRALGMPTRGNGDLSPSP